MENNLQTVAAAVVERCTSETVFRKVFNALINSRKKAESNKQRRGVCEIKTEELIAK